MPNTVIPGLPFFQNFVKNNVALTLTISYTGQDSAPIAVAPAGSPIPFADAAATLFTVYPGQTITVTFEVPYQGFVCNNVTANVSDLTYLVEDALWG
jgi:hypothetical protein